MKIKNTLILLLTATIWGVAFVAQSVGGNVGTFTFNCIRSILAFVFLLAVNRILKVKMNKKNLIAGTVCGICLFLAMTLQQFGVMYSTVGKAGFITAMYLILVPIFQIPQGHKISIRIIISLILATIGLYFLCIHETVHLQIGDLLLLGCAISFSFHILIIDYFVKNADPTMMSCIQFGVVAVLSGILMFIFETPTISSLEQYSVPILYAGICSSGIAYTLQIVGQKDYDPTIASLILSLESSISLLSGAVILHSYLSQRELIGCVFMFIAIILSQLSEKKEEI